MDLRRTGLFSNRLIYFQAVAEKGSIRRAALELNVAPSSISRSLSELEADLGALLFERVGRRLRLSSAGEMLLHHARLSQNQLASGIAFIEDLQGLKRGEVKIAVIESVMRNLMLQELDRFWEHQPGIKVECFVTGSQDAFDGVAEGRFDLAIAFDTPVPVKARKIASAYLNLGVVLPPGHPLATQKKLRLRDLRDENLLLANPSLTLGQLLNQAIAQLGFDLKIRAISNSIDTLLHLAEMGHGITLQTRLGAESEIAAGRLAFIPLSEPGLKPRELVMICRSERQLPHGPVALATQLASRFETLDEGKA
ncbi:LysR family transcriptional regulator [Radicibacter daui]|uniref:LysR family transcriptional regulator n=1 Tax=Radicibacter daui TaxID=3064829 RepID=UPI004046A8CF